MLLKLESEFLAAAVHLNRSPVASTSSSSFAAAAAASAVLRDKSDARDNVINAASLHAVNERLVARETFSFVGKGGTKDICVVMI